MSLNEFKIRWKHWQDECKGRLQRGEYSSDSDLEIVCKVKNENLWVDLENNVCLTSVAVLYPLL